MTTRQYSSRSQQSTLTAAITAGATSFTVVSGTTLLGGVTIPSGRTFTLVIDPDTALEEIVDATAVSTNTFTITRAIDGSTAQAHSAGAVVRHMAIGRDFRDANLHAEATQSYNDGAGVAHDMHGIAAGEGVVVGTLKTQTLTNKTLTAPTITDPTITGVLGGASITFEGSTADAHETTLTVVDPTQDNTITLPNTTGTVTINDATQTLTNKTLTSPTISGSPVITGLSSAGMISSSATPKDYVDSILGSATAAATSAASAATSATSAATSASSASTSASSALTSANSASTSATSAATSATSASNSASAASTSATSASNSASAAATSATSAATSASSASTSASSALTSANSASTSASSALTSANSAATSATSAATSYDSFDDRYLGAKASPPTVDNDGNPLLTGALYWDTGVNKMFVWGGSAWAEISSSAEIFRYRYTAAGGETSESGPDDNGNTLSYLVGKEQVYLNGALLVRTQDYTATTGSSITGLSPALSSGDVLEIITFSAFSISNTLSVTLFDAKGDLLVGTAADTAGKLSAGTNEHRLVADSAAATGLKYVADTTNYAIAAKGDLLVGTAADTVQALTAGSNGDSLVADSAATTGLRWQGSYEAGKNKFINGDFRIWQRGTSLSLSGSGYIADRWKVDSGSTTGTASQQSFTVGQTDVPQNPLYFQRVAMNGSASGVAVIAQWIEGVDTLAGKTATLSFYAKISSGTASLDAQYVQRFGSGGSSAVAAAMGTVNLTTSWQKFTFTASIPSISGKTVGAGNALEIRIIGNVTAISYDFANFQIEEGSVATAFQTATGTLAGELAACARYLPVVNKSAIIPGYAYGTDTAIYAVNFKVPARVAPTGVSVSGTVNAYALNTLTVVTPTLNIGSVDTASLLAGFTITAGQGSRLELQSDALILFTGCEL